MRLSSQPPPAEEPTVIGQLINLRYDGTCASCSVTLRAGTSAWWEREDRALTCLDCLGSADPFTPVDRGLEGTPGGSAMREARNQRRRDRKSWKKGAEGERRLSEYLYKAAKRGDFRLLDDRVVPGSRANIDHIAVAATGVYVIDAKSYEGKVEYHASGFGPWRKERLRVNGRDQTHLTDIAYQVDAVAAALAGEEPAVPVYPVLCFVGAEWEPFARSFTVNGVLVTARGPLRRLLRKRGPIPIARRAALERLLATRLPAAVPRSPTRTNQA